jgi:cytochrome c oxidase subunit 3
MATAALPSLIDTTAAPAHKAHAVAPVTPGKVAIWLFLATEVMFFTGLIGSYIVLRAGSPETGYSTAYSPNTPVDTMATTEGVTFYKWPVPYHHEVNPLSIDMTATNTFILICSSLTMVLALAAVQRGDLAKLKIWLGATVAIGSVFLGVQVVEYYQLMFGHHYPIGVSPTGHFTPDVSLFASCFFTMTGFHGAHVAAGVVWLTCILIGSMQGRFTQRSHSHVELVGLYWHFVDLVWIILFTVVYLV